MYILLVVILCQTECNTRNTVIVSQANSKFSKEKMQYWKNKKEKKSNNNFHCHFIGIRNNLLVRI